jgi:hypothetical protein
MDITFDKIDGNITSEPNIIFKGLQFKLKKFDFDKDVIFQNMTQIKLDKLSFRMMTYYEFNFDNILEKLKELFPSGIVNISDSMFIQLYLYLIRDKFDKRFIFSRELFGSFHEAMYQASLQSQLDDQTHMLYMLCIYNYSINTLLKDSKCFYDHINLIKTGKNKDEITCYTGLTPEGVKTLTVLEWAQYLKYSCKEFFIQTKRVNDIEYESDSRELADFKSEEFQKQMHVYSLKKNLEKLNNYYEIGYFDIWELSNGVTTFAINVEKEKIIDLK